MKPITVYYHWNFFQRGGIYRYFTEVIPRISKEPDLRVRVFGNFSVEKPPEAAEIEQVTSRTPSLPWLRLGALRRALSPLKRRMDRWEWAAEMGRSARPLFHGTHYDPPPLASTPEVTTIYDLIPELFPALAQGGVFDHLRAVKAQSVKRARRILAISQKTKEDVCEFYGVPPERVDVIPLAVDGDFFRTRSSQQEVEWRTRVTGGAPYLLYVGGRAPYKNLNAALQALEALPDFHVVIAGPPWEESERRAVMDRSGAPRLHLVERPDDGQLRALYQGAALFLYPSRYEGFGLPLLEAMAAGTPVVTANAGPMPEVAGEGAVYFEPDKPDSLLAALRQALDPTTARGLIERGADRARTFSWDRTARQTAESYRRAIDG